MDAAVAGPDDHGEGAGVIVEVHVAVKRTEHSVSEGRMAKQ